MEQVLIGGIDDALNFTATEYNSIVGGQGWVDADSRVRQVVSAAGNIKNLRIVLAAAPSAGDSFAFTLMLNGSPTGLTCTVSNTDTTASDMVNEVAVVAGDTISLRVVPTSSPDSVDCFWTMVFDSTTTKESLLLGGVDNLVSSSSTEYSFVSGAVNWNVVQDNRRQVIAAPGNISHLYVELAADPGTAPDAYKFTLMLNGSPTALTCTITADATTGNDTGNSIAVVAGDYVAIRCEPLNTPSVTTGVAWGMKFTATTDGESLIMNGHFNNLSSSTTEYNFLSGLEDDWTTSESDRRQAAQACTLKDLYVLLNDSPGSGNSYIFTLRKGAADTTLEVTIADAATTGNDTANDVAIVNDNLLGMQVVPISVPSSRDAYWGLVCFIAPAGGAIEQVVGSGAIAIAGALNLKSMIDVGAGSIAIAGVLTPILTFLQTVGSGAIAIAGSLGTILTFVQAVGSGSIAIAGALGRVIKLSVGSGSIAIAGALGLKTLISVGAGAVTSTGALGRKIILQVGSGSITIAGALTANLVQVFTQAVGGGAVAISGTLGRLIKISVGGGAITIVGALTFTLGRILKIISHLMVSQDLNFIKRTATALSMSKPVTQDLNFVKTIATSLSISTSIKADLEIKSTIVER